MKKSQNTKKNLLDVRYREVKNELLIYQIFFFVILGIFLNGIYHGVMYITPSLIIIGLMIGFLISTQSLIVFVNKVYKEKKNKKVALTPSKDA